jgi:hypothetical protein
MRMFQRLSARRTLSIEARLARLPFALHPALRINLKAEGYRDYTFGAKVGPTTEFSNLAHELAHAAQFADSFDTRCTPWGSFHLPVHEVTIDGQDYPDPRTGQCTLRELEVFAIQWHLQTLAGCKLAFEEYAEDVVDICSHLPDWWALGGTQGRRTELPKRLKEFLAQWSAPRACAQVTKWLDQTAVRLAIAC